MYHKISSVQKVNFTYIKEMVKCRTNQSRSNVDVVINEFVRSVRDKLKQGYAVSITGLATFFPVNIRYEDCEVVTIKARISNDLLDDTKNISIKYKENEKADIRMLSESELSKYA